MRWSFALFLAMNFARAEAAEDKMRLVRESEALTPEQEQAKLHAPAGFTIQLFASEPMINKPINMAFDARGRLWVSSTVEYPYAAAKERWADAQGSHVKDSRDAIKILEDTDGDGTADKVTDFADGLNIPTGVLPWHKLEDKDGCIAWSIPNIWYFADTDGDGKCDKREVLFGPLGYEKDTHGMCSSFRLGLDGWVYATHGFNNTSHFKAKDGSTLDLNSGNVFRFRPDGSRVELWSAGQVNPFGLCWDRYGNLYSADCHSNPITQLIRGACYPSFGKPHDGLGFAPNMCEHSHGSTGLCGIIYIDGGIWGPEWDDHMFLGNCVTSKVNHDHITFTGSTPKANEQPDFITSDDLWFRPVDLQLGPDNALYIADFYNKIIGHYEVPLDHPGRDKERGRIWRVMKEGVKHLGTKVEDAELPVIRRIRELEAGPPLQLIPPELKRDPFKTPQDSARVNLARVLALRNMAPDVTLRSEAFAHLCMTSALADKSDGVLRHACLLGLRSLIQGSTGLLSLLPHPGGPLPSLDYPADMEQILLSVPQAEASDWLMKYRSYLSKGDAAQIKRIAHAARYGTSSLFDQALAEARKLKRPEAIEAVSAIHNGLLERGSPPPPALLSWATELAESLLAAQQSHSSQWTSLPHPSHPGGQSPWCLQDRKCADGSMAKVISSLDKDKKSPEKLTGILRSKSFAAPEKLSFWLCGHQGLPKTEANRKNLVRLMLGDKLVREAFPPRNDVCQRIEWDLSGVKGREVRLEVVDGGDGPSFAWLGVTRIEPPVVSIETFTSDDEKQKQLRTLAAILKTTAPIGLRDKLVPYLPKPTVAPVPAKPRPELDALIAAHRASITKAKPDIAKGEAIFKANCAICHSIKGLGGVIGPQLDGIGKRGADRLMEDILDPNRNVDAHFHLHQLKLRDGSTATGFIRGEVGQVTILVDPANNEQRIPKGDIIEDKDLPLSLMPPTFGQTIREREFADLIGWLLTQ